MLNPESLSSLFWAGILGSSFLGAVAGSVLKGILDRRLAKRVPKTQARAEVYKDLATYFMVPAGSDPSEGVTQGPRLNEIKARLLVFGESEVICATAEFLKSHQSLDTLKAKAAFCEVIRAMRESVKTGVGDPVTTSISQLLSAPEEEHLERNAGGP